jgi:mono/diheme cytochrome c family protein
MLLTKKLACPSCSARLKVADRLPAGKVITCPKCGTDFPVPDDSGDMQLADGGRIEAKEPAAAEPRRQRVAPVSSKRPDRELETRPRPRKRRKKPQEAASNTPLILGLVIGGAVAILGGVILILVLRPSGNKAEPVAVNSPSSSRPAERAPRPRSGPSGPGMLAQRPGGGEPEPSAPAPSAPRPGAGLPPSEQSRPAAGEADLLAAGRGVFQANNCGRCHSLGGAGGGMRGRGGRGPDLSRVGAKPGRTIDWLAEQIRDPQSHRPDSRMPGYAGKISEDDIHALAVYLASLQ